MTDPTAFNKALDQRDLAPKDGQLPDQRLSCLSVTHGTESCLLPGMELVVAESDAGVNTEQDRTMVQTGRAWIIPSYKDFGQKDLFYLSWLLSVSHNDAVSFDPSLCYEEWLRPAFYPDRFRTEFLKPLIESLDVTFNTGGAAGTGKASDVQAWMRGLPPLTTPGQAIQPRQVLKYTFPLLPAGTSISNPNAVNCVASPGVVTRQLVALQGGSAFQRQRADPIGPWNRPSGWYTTTGLSSGPVESRAFVELFVPVTARHQLGTEYMPMDSSISNVLAALRLDERDFVGIRRNIHLIPISDVPESHESDLVGPSIDIKATSHDLYFPTWNTLYVDKDILSQMLIAPGDEIMIRR
jgi:hypothetical protein